MPERTLTDEDVKAIAEAVAQHTMRCNLGFTIDEVGTLKKVLNTFNKAANLTGAIILTAIITGVIALLTKGFWVSLIQGVKKGA